MSQAIALNKQLIGCDTSLDVLTLLASTPSALTGMAGSGTLNSVNFSTAIHRMARHVSGNDARRASTLSDPRFALFLCSLSEAVAGLDYTLPLATILQQQQQIQSLPLSPNQISFNSRECSNIAWAIAKLRLAPPLRTLPMDLTDGIIVDLVKTSYKLRSQVLEAARDRSTKQEWIPTLSLVAGRLLDAIAYSIVTHSNQRIYNTQEMANLLWAFATSQRADAKVFDCIASSLVKGMQDQQQANNSGGGGGMPPKPQELSNSVWAFATAQICGHDESSSGQVHNLLQYVAQALDERPGFIDEFKAQELSNTAWGVATILSCKRNQQNHVGITTTEKSKTNDDDAVVLRILRHVARCITARADEFKSQELSNTVWAFATLGFGFGEAESTASLLNDYIFLDSDDMEGDQQLMSQALAAVATSAVSRLHMFRSQELNNIAWAFARLERKEATELYKGIGRQFAQPNRPITGQDVGTTLWAFATLEYFDEQVYRVISSRLTIERANEFKPQELSNSVWALATAGVVPKYLDAFDTTLVPPNQRLSLSDMSDDPVTLCFAAAANELMRRPRDFKSQEIKDVMWSFSKAGVRHPRLFKAIAEHLVGMESDLVPVGKIHCGRGLDDFSPQGIGNLAWSYAKQPQLADEAVDRIELCHRDSNGRLAVYSTICVDVGESLVKRLFNCFAEADLTNHAGLTKLKPQDMSNTAWAFAVLGLRHGKFFDAIEKQVVGRLSRKGRNGGEWFKGQELANIVWACATLNNQFPEMMDAIAPYMVKMCQEKRKCNASTIAKHFKRQELANIAWSCAVMGHYPKDMMRLLYTGLVGDGKERDPVYMGEVYGDGGLQRQATMSLLYVQMAMDLEDPDNDLTLPENFPDGWDVVGENGSSAGDAVTETFSMLTLSTSRIQKDVSKRLQRIGFDHVQEHVISTDELVRSHGIRLVEKPLEILSIDIANVKEKVGIEVDGPAHFVSVLDTWSPQEETKGHTKVVNGKLEYQFKWDSRQQINGSTAMKQRLLERLGWKTIHLPFWEWYALNGNVDDEVAYCRNLLGEL